MRETPRSQGTAGDTTAEPPQPRLGCALAHTTGASGSGTPHRSDGRPSQTPRGARQTGPAGPLGTTPPVPRRPASLLSASLVALCAVVFAVITWQVAADGPLRSLDERVELRIVDRGPWTLTGQLADLGSMEVALPVLGAAIAYAVWRGHRTEALDAGLAMAAVPALVAPLKALIDRQGPLTEVTGFYPSGHAATAMVAYCGAAMLITPYLRRGWAMPVAVVLTLATGIGLVLHGYHWPLDVIGSWCLCGMLLIVNSIRRRRSSSRTPTG
ncbi:phosphatase PAP2 family protein [Streptomyces sp. NPDC005407]|uniref:phosphatase PAP2 family protein n=1 Tax=Streptomyces sp. NPDC005407 TaxID=3155340 RepID=UPI0033B6EE72